jgi:predicted transposase/invertase (TIGR01784 family)
MRIPEILPPRDDGVFKTILTHPDAEPVLRDILESILGSPVTDIVVRNVETPVSDINEKRERFDVNCKIGGDRQAEIEMQADPMKGDSAGTRHENIRSRSVFNLCSLHASQPGRGVRYGSLMRSFQIIFCNYTVFPERDGYTSRFSFRAEDGGELSDAVNIIFIELTKLTGLLKKPADEMSPGDMWPIFFKYADNPKYRKLIDELASKKEEINMAARLLASISKDEKERAHYLSRKMFRMDLEHSMAVSRDEGRAEGFRDGEAIGRRDGKVEGKIEVAKNLLLAGLAPADIVRATGLPAAEIEKLIPGA